MVGRPSVCSEDIVCKTCCSCDFASLACTLTGYFAILQLSSACTHYMASGCNAVESLPIQGSPDSLARGTWGGGRKEVLACLSRWDLVLEVKYGCEVSLS